MGERVNSVLKYLLPVLGVLAATVGLTWMFLFLIVKDAGKEAETRSCLNHMRAMSVCTQQERCTFSLADVMKVQRCQDELAKR